MIQQVKNSLGVLEVVNIDKIRDKLESLCTDLNMNFINVNYVVDKVSDSLCDNLTTKQIDTLSAEICAGLVTTHPDYNLLGGRILMSRLIKDLKRAGYANLGIYSDVFKDKHSLYRIYRDEFQMLRRKGFPFIPENSLNYTYDFFSVRTLEKSYFLKDEDAIIETPEAMLLRVFMSIYGDIISDDLSNQEYLKMIDTYKFLFTKQYTFATSTLFNAGLRKQQLASCFLLAMKEDSITGIYDTVKDCAMISKNSAGIGMHIHNIRAAGSKIKSTNGVSNGIVPMLQVFNHTARYVDQGGGKRKGAIAVYLEPWHADIMEFLELRKNQGAEEMRTRDLFTALWVPDLFMKRVENNEKWSLFCPSDVKDLLDCYGIEFEIKYCDYEKKGIFKKQIYATDLFDRILVSQIETGTPYMLYKDSCNRKSNEGHLGVIKSSNLCAEIIEYSSPRETAVCNLASLSLPSFIKDGEFSFYRLSQAIRSLVHSMNILIDKNVYPTRESKFSNKKSRPLGIGVQGLADVFMMLKMPFGSQESKELNVKIFETMYYYAMRSSIDLAKKYGRHDSFIGSHLSFGSFQFDLWNVKPSDRYDWESLREDVMKYGTRNSLLIALMPTASTAQILGNTECFEPMQTNIFKRRVLSGEFIVINKHLIKDLIDLGLWGIKIKEQIMKGQGSIQHIESIPREIRDLYKTVWEIKQKDLVDMAADRGPYVCQSQSLNLFFRNPDKDRLASAHFYGWKRGLKTGLYYLRSTAAVEAQAFTVSGGNHNFENNDCLSCQA